MLSSCAQLLRLRFHKVLNKELALGGLMIWLMALQAKPNTIFRINRAALKMATPTPPRFRVTC